ncbi:MAG TPA: hypothetical protein VFS37_04605 [Conexibacter sp.]|nr:hypothetical protein [Conexibacter sp.]
MPRIRQLPFLLVLALAAVALAACGGAGSGSSGPSDEEKRLAFEDCLRDHGVDVQTSADGRTAIRMTARAGGPGAGATRFGSGGPDDPDGPFATCRRQTGWAPSPPTAAQRAEMRDRALKIARCMRAHGVDMADPAPDGRQLIRVDGDSPTFRAAARACGLGVPGGPPPDGRDAVGFSAAP